MTIFYDRYGLRLWFPLAIGMACAVNAATERHFGWSAVLNGVAAAVWLGLSALEWRRRMKAKALGQDPTIVRIEE